MQRRNRNRGFTLIEIVLVLALASLLMLVVFQALSGAQKARRDSQRKSDLAYFFASLETYRSNNDNVHPTNQPELDKFAATYFPNRKDPLTGQDYIITWHEATHNPHPVEGEIIYGREHYCKVNTDTNPDDVISDIDADFEHDHYMMVYQEQGGYYCLDNHAR